MINLLPDIKKNDIKAARANVILLRYMGLVALAFAFIAGSVLISYLLLQSTMRSADELISTNDIKADVYSQTKAEVDELSAKLSTAKEIADQEVRFSRALQQLGSVMPAGTILGKTTLTEASFSGTPVELTAYAASTSAASSLQSALQTSPLFSEVTLSGTEAEGGIANYPVKVALTVTFNRQGIK